MLPRINPRGKSFKGITSYLLHGKIGEENAARVEWSMTGNMYTNDIEKAAKVMAFTAMNAEDIKREAGGSLAGSKAEGKAVYHNTLSWRVGDNPSEQHMKETAHDYLVERKLENQEYYIVAHNDTDHKHLHIVVNLVDHETGKTIKLGRDKMAAQAWALEYERKHGIQCELREENAAKREQGQAIKHQDQKQDYSIKITRAYYAADNGKSFVNSLNAEGLSLAKSRRSNGFVIVDEKGDIQKLARQLDIEEKGKQKTAAIANLLKDVDREKIEDAAELSKKIKINLEKKQEIFDRDTEETNQQNKLLDAAEISAEHQIKIDQDVSRIAGDIRLKLWDKYELNLKALKKKQGYELTDYIQGLRDTDSEKEAQHRAFYAPEISADRQEKLSLQQQLKGSGLKGTLFRIRHGKKTISRIKALEKNIANGEMRLNEGVGGIDRFDYKKIQKKKAEHRRAIDSFKNNHDRDIKKAEQQAREQIERITNDFSTQENIKFNIEKTSKTTMDRNPLHELRGGMDKAGREERNNSLSVGQGENRLENIELLQIQVEGKRRVEEATRKAQQEQQKQIEIQRAVQAQKQLQAIKEAQKQTVKQSLSNDNFGDEFLSKDEIAENVKAQQSQHQNNGLSGSFMDELSAEQRQKIEDYKEENPAPDHDDIGEKQERGHRPELE